MASNGRMVGEFGRDVEGSDRSLFFYVIMPLEGLRRAIKRSSYGSPGRGSEPRTFQIRSMCKSVSHVTIESIH
jgi:hypothetical protein